jgi:hypothetical protein
MMTLHAGNGHSVSASEQSWIAGLVMLLSEQERERLMEIVSTRMEVPKISNLEVETEILKNGTRVKLIGGSMV